jgi:hypothetical protein
MRPWRDLSPLLICISICPGLERMA